MDAIQQLHMDCALLLQDCDSTIGKGRASIFGGQVTREYSTLIDGAHYWMAIALYRYYAPLRKSPRTVPGVTLILRNDPNAGLKIIEEPILVVGDVTVLPNQGKIEKTGYLAWALWHCYLSGENPVSLDEVHVSEWEDMDNVKSARFIATQLLTVRSDEDVSKLYERVTASY